jgi:hypothetical protein
MATVTYGWGADVFDFVLNAPANGSQTDVAITATADGGYLGAWSVNSGFVRGRDVDADGTPGAEGFLNTTQDGSQFDASMALLGNGHNVVTFTDHSSGIDTVRIRILGDGAPALDFAVPSSAKPCGNPTSRRWAPAASPWPTPATSATATPTSWFSATRRTET